MKYLSIVLLSFSFSGYAQKSGVFKLTTEVARTTRFAKGWIALDSGWKFKAGDNPDWARPGFNDSSWQSINLFQDLYDLPQVPKSGIMWFRLRLKSDSTLFNRQLVMRIYQTGASEVYLDGKLLHRLGIVSANGEYNFPEHRNGPKEGPLLDGSMLVEELVSATRFAGRRYRSEAGSVGSRRVRTRRKAACCCCCCCRERWFPRRLP